MTELFICVHILIKVIQCNNWLSEETWNKWAILSSTITKVKAHHVICYTITDNQKLLTVLRSEFSEMHLDNWNIRVTEISIYSDKSSGQNRN